VAGLACHSGYSDLYTQRVGRNTSASALESFEVELDGIYKRVSAIQDKPEAWMAMLTWLSGEGWEKSLIA